MTIPVINRKLKNGKIRKITVDTGEILKEVHICVQEKIDGQDLFHRNAINIKHDEIPQVVNAMLKAAELPDNVIKFMDDSYLLMDKYIKLKSLLEEVPESKNTEEFDQILESRRQVWRELHKIVEEIGEKLEQEWAGKLWLNVKDKGG